jgi:HSP20 family molecular chaperone IbpA
MRIRWRSPASRIDQLDITVDENELVIRGRQQEDKSPGNTASRSIAAVIQRTFVLADGMQCWEPI